MHYIIKTISLIFFLSFTRVGFLYEKVLSTNTQIIFIIFYLIRTVFFNFKHILYNKINFITKLNTIFLLRNLSLKFECI